LKDFSFYEYAGCITIVKIKSKLPSENNSDDENTNQEDPEFRSKQFVPILAGAPPPSYPGTQKNHNFGSLRHCDMPNTCYVYLYHGTYRPYPPL